MHETRWTGAHWLKEFDYKFVIGATWVEVDQIPYRGVLSFKFICQKKEWAKHDDRLQFAMEFFNWGTHVFHPKAPVPAFAEHIEKDVFSTMDFDNVPSSPGNARRQALQLQ